MVHFRGEPTLIYSVKKNTQQNVYVYLPNRQPQPNQQIIKHERLALKSSQNQAPLTNTKKTTSPA